MNCKKFCSRYGQFIAIFFGISSVIVGIVFMLYFPSMFDKIFFKELALREGSKSYEYWISPPQPLYLDIYLWNWTNPEEFTNKSINPKFEEIGPFRFQEIPKKVNVRFHDDNSTVSYRKSSQYFFVPEQSKGRMDDVITSINVISLAAATQAKNWGFFGTRALGIGLKLYNANYYVTKNASEWLFDGFEDPMINTAKNNPFITNVPTMFDKFGWFYKKNNSDVMLGDFNVDTGADDITKIGNIRSWNYESQTQFYEGQCGKLTGSGGDFFTPNITKDKVLELFSPEMCRSVSMDFEEEVTIHGVKTLKFSGGDRAVDNGTLYPENECFCSGECVPKGLFNVSSCRYGTPVFMSFPHFYYADDFYLNQIDGMNPDEDKHKFFMAFEPKTAIPLEVAARFQINLLIEPIPSIALYRDVQKKFMPILWFEQHVKMSESIADEIKLVLKMPKIGQVIGAVQCIIGFIILMAVPIIKLSTYRRTRKVKDFDMNGNVLLTVNKLNENLFLPADKKTTVPEAKKLLEKK